MGKYFKLVMFITSFLPLWITIMFIDTLNIIRDEAALYTEKISLVAIIIVLLFSFTIIYKSIKQITPTNYKTYIIESVVQEKGITSEFLLSYILPLVAFDFTMWESVVQFLLYFIVLAFLCIRNNNVYANLLFECKGYKFYDCELIWAAEPNVAPLQGLIISKSNLSAQKGNTIKIASLNKPFYIKSE